MAWRLKIYNKYQEENRLLRQEVLYLLATLGHIAYAQTQMYPSPELKSSIYHICAEAEGTIKKWEEEFAKGIWKEE